MASTAIIAALRMQAATDLDRECGAMAERLGIDPPTPIGKERDPANAHRKSLESMVDFVSRANAKLGEGGPDETPADAEESDAATTDAPASDGEPTFAGHPLSFFAGMSDEDVLAVKGVAAKTLERIRTAQQS